MASNFLKVLPASLTLFLLILEIHSATITRPIADFDIRGNPLENNGLRTTASPCCIMTSKCESSTECYETLKCGYNCAILNNSPAEYNRTPGYKLRASYKKYECRYGQCRYYDFACFSQCQDPSEFNFSFHQVHQDCRNCYYLPYGENSYTNPIM